MGDIEDGSWEWVMAWKSECGFQRHVDAAKAIGCDIRTWYRWFEGGLPSGLYGELVAEKMEKIRFLSKEITNRKVKKAVD